MFNFDDRFIVLAILIPGVFLLGNIYLALYFLYPEVIVCTFNFGFIESVYGLVVALILGALAWRVHTWRKVIDAFSTKNLLKKIKADSYHTDFVNFDELEKRYQKDFRKPFLTEKGESLYQQDYLNESINNMYFTMHRALGLEKPSAYRLMLDAYANLFIATLLSALFFIVAACVRHFYFGYAISVHAWCLLGMLVSISLLLRYGVVPKSREKYHFAIIMVYLDNQYRKRIENFINGN